jgi:hypothetical protein
MKIYYLFNYSKSLFFKLFFFLLIYTIILSYRVLMLSRLNVIYLVAGSSYPISWGDLICPYIYFSLLNSLCRTYYPNLTAVFEWYYLSLEPTFALLNYLKEVKLFLCTDIGTSDCKVNWLVDMEVICSIDNNNQICF